MMKRSHFISTIGLWAVAAFLLMCGHACAQQEKKPTPKRPQRIEEHVAYRAFETMGHSTYILDKTVDLGGKAWQLPEGVTIVCRGGIFRNGTLAGNNTCIKGEGTVFDHVTIKAADFFRICRKAKQTPILLCDQQFGFRVLGIGLIHIAQETLSHER